MCAPNVVVSSSGIYLRSIWNHLVLLLLMQGVLMALGNRTSLHSLSTRWLTFPLRTGNCPWYLAWLWLSVIVIDANGYLLRIVSFEKVVLSIGADARVFEVYHVSTALLHLVELLIAHVEVSFRVVAHWVLLTVSYLSIFIWTFSCAFGRVIINVLMVEAWLWMPLLVIGCILCSTTNWSRVQGMALIGTQLSSAIQIDFPTICVTIICELNVFIDIIW